MSGHAVVLLLVVNSFASQAVTRALPVECSPPAILQATVSALIMADAGLRAFAGEPEPSGDVVNREFIILAQIEKFRRRLRAAGAEFPKCREDSRREVDQTVAETLSAYRELFAVLTGLLENRAT